VFFNPFLSWFGPIFLLANGQRPQGKPAEGIIGGGFDCAGANRIVHNVPSIPRSALSTGFRGRAWRARPADAAFGMKLTAKHNGRL
jgi:hypothetical protein